MKAVTRFLIACCMIIVVANCAKPGPAPSNQDVIKSDAIKKEKKVAKTNKPPEASSDKVFQQKSKVIANRLNMRQKPSSKSKIMEVLNKGDVLTIESEKGKWFEVETQSGKQGWVFGRYIEPIADVSSTKKQNVSKSISLKSEAAKKELSNSKKATAPKDAPAISFVAAKKHDLARNDFAKGYLEVDGEKVPLKYAYSKIVKDPFDSDKQAIEVAFTNKRVPLDSWHDPFEDWAKGGKIQSVELHINSSRHITGVIIESPLIKGGYVSSAGGHKFTAKHFGPTVVEGTAFTDMMEFNEQKFRYEADFKVTLTDDKGGNGKKTGQKNSDLYNKSIFDSPINKAIEKMLLASGEDEVLKTTTGISSSATGSFARAFISCKQNGNNVKLPIYLFKNGTQWEAYKEIPTQLDHEGMFFMLARNYCTEKLENLNGMGYLDDSWKSKDPRKRAINYNCMELENKQWKDHHLTIIFEYDRKKGWHITKVDPFKQLPINNNQADTSEKPASSTDSKPEEVEFADDVVDRFFLSIADNDMDAVKGFLDDGMSPNVKRPRLGTTPLLFAAISNHEEMALMFIDAGGDVNAGDQNNATALMWAAGNCKSVKLVKALLKAGANVNARAKGGGTPLVLAEARACKEIVNILKKAGGKK